MPRGGYQRPSAPAPVSGPGAKSKRTDGGPAQKLRDLPDAQYGEAAVYRDLQQSAPLAQTPSPKAAGATQGGGASLPFAFGDASARPDEEVTTGIPLGPGAGPEALRPMNTNREDVDRMRDILPALEVLASLPSTSTETRNFIRYVRGASR